MTAHACPLLRTAPPNLMSCNEITGRQQKMENLPNRSFVCLYRNSASIYQIDRYTVSVRLVSVIFHTRAVQRAFHSMPLRYNIPITHELSNQTILEEKESRILNRTLKRDKSWRVACKGCFLSVTWFHLVEWSRFDSQS